MPLADDEMRAAMRNAAALVDQELPRWLTASPEGHADRSSLRTAAFIEVLRERLAEARAASWSTEARS
jgi:hypothetical protein